MSAGPRLLLSLLGFASIARSDTPPTAGPGSPPADAISTLPTVTVSGDTLKNYPPIPKALVTEPDFGPTALPLEPFYPGPAIKDGVTEGSATVGVELDETGKATDFLVLRYTRSYFGDSLLQAARTQTYAPRKVLGRFVASRFVFTNRFVPDLRATVTIDSFAAAEERRNEIRGGPIFIYHPYLERELDGGSLKLIRPSYAVIPEGYESPGGKSPPVLVSFYVDEKGHVRLPDLASAPASVLIPSALKAASYWQFAPPTIKGRPVLVFALWRVIYVPRSAVKRPQ